MSILFDNNYPGAETATSPEQREIEELRRQVSRLRSVLGTVLDCVDFERGACRVNEPVGAVLPTSVLSEARKALGR